MARTYGCLPSQVLREADTFDLMVLDVSIANSEIENAKAQGKALPAKYYKEADLLERIEKLNKKEK